MRTAFDMIGSREKAVAIVDKSVTKKQALEIIKKHKSIVSVLKKTSGRSGKYRKYKFKLITGNKNTEVIHKEHSLKFKLDPQKTYFSPREATERQRILKKIKPKEKVLVMFSGIGPFGIVIAKAKPKAKVTCIELNRSAVKYSKENELLNKIKNMESIAGDVSKVTKGKYDRIIMPLPETAYQFLKVAKKHCKKSGIIHLYGFSGEDKFKDMEKEIKKIHGLRILKRSKILPYAPKKWKVRFDLKKL